MDKFLIISYILGCIIQRVKKKLRIERIKKAVNSLPVDEYRQFRNWFLELDWQLWDKKLQADSESGNLDFLIKEALDEKSQGKLRNL